MSKDLLSDSIHENIEVHSQKEVSKEKKLLGQIIPFKGHTLFEINCATGEIVEPEYKVEAIKYESAISGSIRKSRSVIVKENCLYISCLNKKSARKKFLKYLMSNSKNIKVS